MVRRLARPMLAAWFLTEGIGAVRRPQAHAAQSAPLVGSVCDLLGTERPGPDRLTTVARAHGAATVLAAACLALGKAPRLAAAGLVALTVPVVVASLPAAPAGTQDPAGSTTPAGAGRRASGICSALKASPRFWQSLSMLGGALLAAIDTEGRPTARYRRQVARETRAAVGAAPE